MTRALVAAIAVASALVSCEEPFTLDSGTFAGKTYTYSQGTGRDQMSYVFDSTGVSGSFEKVMYEYGYKTSADLTAADASKKAWIHTGGSKGTFSYDPKTYTLSTVTTHIYSKTKAATPVGSLYSDYAYLSYLDYANFSHSTPLYAKYSSSFTTNAVFTTDNLEPLPLIKGTGSVWSYTGKSSWSLTLTAANGGTTDSQTTEVKMSLDISSTAIKSDTVVVTTTIAGTSAPSKATNEMHSSLLVDKFTVVGETPTAPEFDSVWVDGKTLTFYTTTTLSSVIDYTGETAPKAPTTFVDGVASISGYIIDKNQVSSSQTVENRGTYILVKPTGNAAGRSLF